MIPPGAPGPSVSTGSWHQGSATFVRPPVLIFCPTRSGQRPACICDRYAADSASAWPSSLRVKEVEGAPGVFEMTWSFSGPDGWATFEWIEIEGELAVRWRRIGRHDILRNP